MRQIVATTLLAVTAASMAAGVELFTLTVEDVPAENGKVLTATFREVERKPTLSIIEVVHESGGSVSSSMFMLRGTCGLARARGEQFFTAKPLSRDPIRMEVTFPKTGPEPNQFGPLKPGEPVVFSIAQCEALKF